jgi:5S rRNA maturation endonuclease (ribonuclease M5)
MEYGNRYSFPCPIHCGDNPEGCSIFTDGDDVVGNWKCWTGGCEEDYAQNIFGFVRGCLSTIKGDPASLKETYDFCLSITNKKPEEVSNISVTNSVNAKLIDIFLSESTKSTSEITREQIRSKVNIPAQYYIDRGYTKEVLDEFDIGLCSEKGKPMYDRVVVPIYDYEYNYVGCVGRSTSENLTPKWLHSKGFKKEHLYGLNIAKDHITEDRSLFILEGQGDVWRMHEAGYKNSVSIFGASLSDNQLVILEEMGIMKLIILTDYDEAGNKAAQQIMKKCGRRFNYIRPKLSAKDVGDMSVGKLQQELISQL